MSSSLSCEKMEFLAMYQGQDWGIHSLQYQGVMLGCAVSLLFGPLPAVVSPLFELALARGAPFEFALCMSLSWLVFCRYP